jgi:HEPN domain-containing protein
MGSEAARWLAVANTDLKAVRNNLHGPEPTLEVAAYHCQQAAEKIVKAALVAAGVDPPRWHNIDDLVDLLPVGHMLKKPLAPLGRLTPYAVAYRYPMPDPDIAPDIPTPEDVMQWLDDLQRAKAAVATAAGGALTLTTVPSPVALAARQRRTRPSGQIGTVSLEARNTKNVPKILELRFRVL